MPTTDDLRIRAMKELAPPAHLIREFPVSQEAADVASECRSAIHRILHGMDDRLLVIVGPVLDPRSVGGARVRLAAGRAARAAEGPAGDRHAGLLREAAHDGGLEGADQRPGPRRQLRHQQGPAHRPRAAARHQSTGPAGRHRIPRHDHPAVHRRPDLLGRDRRAHHRVAGASRTGFGPVLPGRLQERHRRQHPDRARRHQGGLAAAPFPVGDQGRAFARSSRPAATRTATSSCAAARRPTTIAPASTPPAARPAPRRSPAG